MKDDNIATTMLFIVAFVMAITFFCGKSDGNGGDNSPNDNNAHYDYSWCEWDMVPLDTSDGLIIFANRHGMSISEFIRLNSDQLNEETFYTNVYPLGHEFRIKRQNNE